MALIDDCKFIKGFILLLVTAKFSIPFLMIFCIFCTWLKLFTLKKTPVIMANKNIAKKLILVIKTILNSPKPLSRSGHSVCKNATKLIQWIKRKLNTSYGLGMDHIPVFILKMTSALFVCIYSLIINYKYKIINYIYRIEYSNIKIVFFIMYTVNDVFYCWAKSGEKFSLHSFYFLRVSCAVFRLLGSNLTYLAIFIYVKRRFQ